LLTFDQIKQLAELVYERGLGALEVEHAGFRLKIEGAETEPVQATAVAPVVAAPAVAAAAAPPAAPAAAAAAAPPPAAAEPAAATPDEPGENLHLLKSPIVGTFYGAPSPESDPYVQTGSQVRKGQVLCIIEAMKLMNEIESDVDGEIVEIHPRNGQPVEFGEPLFGIRAR
jgi:acetyl-CoA carboxylase biotin carboxyl carrier protein